MWVIANIYFIYFFMTHHITCVLPGRIIKKKKSKKKNQFMLNLEGKIAK